MREAAHLLESVAKVAYNSGSRIPHLRQHILARHSGSKVSTTPKCRTLQPCRRLHDSASQQAQSYTFGVTFPSITGEVTPSTVGGVSSRLSTAAASPPPIPQHIDISEERHPDRLLLKLLGSATGRDFIQQANHDSFARAFTAIDPKYLIEPFKTAHRFVTPDLEGSHMRSLQDRFQTFAAQIDTIVNIREEAGHKLTLDVYRHVLACAAAMGDDEMAEFVFRTSMPRDGVVPDLQCYNHYMKAVCWARAWSKGEQWRLRVTPRILDLRSRYRRPSDLMGHRVARVDVPGDTKGLRHLTLSTFQDMVGSGLRGDEVTFTNLMVAMGRENDMQGVKSILKSVYNIDADLLTELDEEEIETPTFYAEDSPLRPTQLLLFTVAHVFGSNNQVGLAMKLVDYISRQYNLEISFDVWLHILEWTFVLSLHRTKVQERQGQAIGQVSHAALEHLWEVMTDQPHNINPDITMVLLLAKGKRKLQRLNDTVSYVRKARDMLDQVRTRLYTLEKELLDWFRKWLEEPPGFDQLPPEWFDLRQQFLLAAIEFERDLRQLDIELRSSLQEKDWKYKREFARHRLPQYILEFSEYLPDVVWYETGEGRIEIAFRETDEERRGARWRVERHRINLIRSAIDTEDYSRLLLSLRELPRTLELPAEEGDTWDDPDDDTLL